MPDGTHADGPHTDTASAPPADLSRSGATRAAVRKVLGGLEMQEEIGRGAMGVVFRATDPVLRRDVAVKMLRSTDEMSDSELAQFRYEAALVASLDHPNIVRVLACDETPEGTPFLVMPLLTGGTLGTWLKGLPDRKLDQRLAARILRDTALGVHHAHQRGLIHRDLKPANILLDTDLRPHVADFGLARPVDVAATSEAGTPAYMAPEQARGDRHLTTAVDVYALGVVLFQLLAGEVPFGGDIGSIFRRVTDPAATAPPVRRFRPDVSPDLEAVVQKCLEKDPARRYSSARELADDLTRFLVGEPVAAQLPGLWDWLRQLARIRPEPHTDYSWPVTVWFGALVLASNGTIFALVEAGGSAAWVWVVNAASGAAMAAVLWWYMLRRFRLLPATERHSLIVAAGSILAHLILTVAYVPPPLDHPAHRVLHMYPALAAVSGMGLFIIGSTNWCRFFPFGLLVLALSPVSAWWPHTAPLAYGVTVAAIMWYWSYAKAVIFAPRDAPKG
ncbi:serine threonine protein kinase : Serine/threonine protein kinase OS=Singulisphaera acidiphila (strain ATCC BAA-1392 / DSM 18658 / VKM B-2454 / MOB10) GN=Sinac_1051 PE=4 SV=1: Pkinase [Gemmataceae bacterium]|nr:serine threonine protein kinase : Serine/threonine protein kinase OS=Singulisphaera acidiphila (strain ATCC BAA-1392 / DSM 18658 / VKM B-2454 / MOB10) GN=Sinac_1051 PE=4 SV=1: Pkinase [Gemmataceae bacterium]VTT98056.1 serine threonine protein kinase : Serine/threonine protein kinase OS=Singulisphaera acidiphila (strain ATCC BAA-1392 / DSM 18658 / VKM B-2454 / MOB10) GN=Sinac_1051 PE=4 SV=1: Pkinase [Gemmataceae bacterium]